MPPYKGSVVLESVTIHSDGDQVIITCHFRNDSLPSERCVVVSRKSTESVLMVEYYPMDSDFPVTLHLSELESYSVAVFGWSEGKIEPFPAELYQVNITGTSQGNHVPLFLKTYTYIAGSQLFQVVYVWMQIHQHQSCPQLHLPPVNHN